MVSQPAAHLALASQQSLQRVLFEAWPPSGQAAKRNPNDTPVMCMPLDTTAIYSLCVKNTTSSKKLLEYLQKAFQTKQVSLADSASPVSVEGSTSHTKASDQPLSTDVLHATALRRHQHHLPNWWELLQLSEVSSLSIAVVLLVLAQRRWALGKLLVTPDRMGQVKQISKQNEASEFKKIFRQQLNQTSQIQPTDTQTTKLLHQNCCLWLDFRCNH